MSPRSRLRENGSRRWRIEISGEVGEQPGNREETEKGQRDGWGRFLEVRGTRTYIPGEEEAAEDATARREREIATLGTSLLLDDLSFPIRLVQAMAKTSKNNVKILVIKET